MTGVIFTPCQGKEYCTEDGSVCKGCGRDHEAIRLARQLVDEIAETALVLDYDNVADFAHYLAAKATKKVAYRRRKAAEEAALASAAQGSTHQESRP